ncbi:uncharacterized protein LOC119554475 [Drosophila subpulchrella]|uniref:uncharacterized protein LOC119554475 n=1 Tax=Drosophila subpulchrella TaxID=1486046 RepID=UPI0018A13D1E|nr:uncharacterized protein LOC119554475 [Drosophila subpulchrella]
MRIREKRKLQREEKRGEREREKKEHKESSKTQDNNNKEKPSDTEGPTPAHAPAPAPPPTSTTPPSLPAAEKVAFDNRIKRKNVLALNEKVAALREYDRLPVYKHVGRLFNCSPDQIKRIVQQRQEILNAWDQRTRRSQDAKTMETKTVRVSMLGKAVYDWMRRMMYYKDFSISDGLIQKMALQFKSSMGLAHFFPHQEWCDKFRRTYSIQHSDTRLLKIGYTQGYSVQIKDIVKDVMSECMPDSGQRSEALDDDEEVSLGSPLSSNPRSCGDDEDDEVDVDGGGVSGREDDLEEEPDVKPSLSELNLARALQPLPPLVRLPLQTNAPPGTSQKVLLATPIVPPQAGGQPMTMTIIPLATLAQSITQVPTPQQQDKGPAVPPPKLEIKQEKDIKMEPKDPEEFLAEQSEEKLQQNESQAPSEKEFEAPAAVQIKVEPEPEPELETEMEMEEEPEDLDDDANNGRSSVTSLAEVLAANVEDEMEYIERMRQRKMSSPAAIEKPLNPRQGTKRRHESGQDDNNNGESGQGSRSSSVISCADARKYLKLIEEFALYKENYRLIGLITRADEVMREMDDNVA